MPTLLVDALSPARTLATRTTGRPTLSTRQPLPQSIDLRLEGVGIPRIVNHNVRRLVPSSTVRLSRHAVNCVVYIHAAFAKSFHPDIRVGVDNHPQPTRAHEIGEEGHLDYDHLLCRLPDQNCNLFPDGGVSEPFGKFEIYRVTEHDIGQSTAVNHTIDHDRRPRLRNLVEGRSVAFQHPVPDLVGIDHQGSPSAQQLADRALPGSYPAGEQNPHFPVRHDE